MVRRRFTQHIAHPGAQRITGIHGAEEVSLQGNVIPLHARIILHTTTFDGFIKQRTLCSENMLAAGFIEFARFQLTLHTLNISNAALPQRAPFSILKLRTVTEAYHLQPGVLQQSININGRGRTAFALTHVLSTAKSSSSGSPSMPGT
ncbi:hypothetical protein D3C77_604780 [compost metagenome]